MSVALALLATPLWAQTSRGKLSGRATDDSDAGLPGVTVTATSPTLQGIRVTQTNIDGDYTFVAMPPGSYRLSYELEGFVATVQTLEVSADQETVSEISMEISETYSELAVTTICFPIQTSPPWLDWIEELPIRHLLASVQPVPGSAAAPGADL
ncbi:MAG: carboxypeptidase regulatory-like domain-containing protein [bacterium]|nr:carboxypeptidase regulatory-like domain-containing protein [bacterium]